MLWVSVVGCVVDAEPGVLTVLSDGGRVRATLDGSLLGRLACSRDELPAVGEWVRLRRWPDQRVTVLGRLAIDAGEVAAVLPFARRA